MRIDDRDGRAVVRAVVRRKLERLRGARRRVGVGDRDAGRRERGGRAVQGEPLQVAAAAGLRVVVRPALGERAGGRRVAVVGRRRGPVRPVVAAVVALESVELRDLGRRIGRPPHAVGRAAGVVVIVQVVQHEDVDRQRVAAVVLAVTESEHAVGIADARVVGNHDVVIEHPVVVPEFDPGTLVNRGVRGSEDQVVRDRDIAIVDVVVAFTRQHVVEAIVNAVAGHRQVRRHVQEPAHIREHVAANRRDVAGSPAEVEDKPAVKQLAQSRQNIAADHPARERTRGGRTAANERLCRSCVTRANEAGVEPLSRGVGRRAVERGAQKQRVGRQVQIGVRRVVTRDRRAVGRGRIGARASRMVERVAGDVERIGERARATLDVEELAAPSHGIAGETELVRGGAGPRQAVKLNRELLGGRRIPAHVVERGAAGRERTPARVVRLDAPGLRVTEALVRRRACHGGRRGVAVDDATLIIDVVRARAGHGRQAGDFGGKLARWCGNRERERRIAVTAQSGSRASRNPRVRERDSIDVVRGGRDRVRLVVRRRDRLGRNLRGP